MSTFQMKKGNFLLHFLEIPFCTHTKHSKWNFCEKWCLKKTWRWRIKNWIWSSIISQDVNLNTLNVNWFFSFLKLLLYLILRSFRIFNHRSRRLLFYGCEKTFNPSCQLFYFFGIKLNFLNVTTRWMHWGFILVVMKHGNQRLSLFKKAKVIFHWSMLESSCFFRVNF
jgi:hypothetical protein